MLPNVIVRHYDQAHGARRLTSRPWSADDFANEVVETLIFARESLCMIISNSEEFQRWLKSNLNRPDCQNAVDTTAASAGIRKHRWDSTCIPLARAVLRHHAFTRTAIQIASTRKGDFPGDCAEYFLFFVSGPQGIKRLLMLGMLADAGDESLLIVRAHDKKKADPAETAFWIASYVRRIQTLFLESECLKLGYTKVMMDTLKTPLVYVVRGAPLQCGSQQGATPDDQQYCLAKMKCWARLAIATAAAEFPEFCTMHAMSIFSLRQVDIADFRHKEDSVVQAGHANVDEKLKTLATAFSVDQRKLASQYEFARNLAQASSNSILNCCDREAWRRALRRCERSRSADLDVSELVVVARAWLGWTSHTSDVERCFSQYQALFASSRRASTSRQREQDLLTLCADWSKHEEDAVVNTAIEIWQSRCYNTRTPRGSGAADRIKARPGKRGGSAPGKMTMTAFSKTRRRAVGLATQNASSAIVNKRKLEELTEAAWTPSMQAEEDHMKRKRATRLVEVTAAGLDPGPGLLRGYSRAEIVDLYAANQERLADARQQNYHRKQLAFKPRVAQSLHGKSIKFVTAGAARSCTAVISELRLKACLRACCLLACLPAARMLACLPGAPPPPARLPACLHACLSACVLA